MAWLWIMRSVVLIAMLVVGSAAAPQSDADTCVLPVSYWQDHPEAWPEHTLVLGSVAYSQDQLLAILQQADRGNALVVLAHQLIAAKLNIAKLGANPIESTLEDADELVGDLVVPPFGVDRLAPAEATEVVSALAAFNSHDECAARPACGDGHVDPGEDCDDGNTDDGDGCSAKCET